MSGSPTLIKIENPYPVFREDFVQLQPGREMRLGRGEDNEIVVINQFVSRHHLTLRWERDKLLLADLKSLNGTKLNGKVVKNNKELKVGDRIEISNVKITILQGEGELMKKAVVAPAPRPSSSLPIDQTIAGSVTMIDEAPHRGERFVREESTTLWEANSAEILRPQRRSIVLPLAIGLVVTFVVFLFL